MDIDEIKRLDQLHVMHSWSVNKSTSSTVITDVEGVYLIDECNNKILDFSAQLKAVNLGYKNNRVIRAMQEQAEKVCYIGPNFAYESRSKLAQALAKITPGDLNKFFFTLAGADANENAIKMARFYTKKHKILSYYRSYHGATYGAITLAGDPRRTPIEPGVPGVVRVLNPYCYRCPFGLTHPDCNLQCVLHVEEVIQYENPETIAAIILEPIVGAGGVIIPPDGYLQQIKTICEKNEILLIADEIMTGFGRTGKWFGVEHWNVVPDLMTIGKGLTSAYVPLGAVAIARKISDSLDKDMLYCGLTYSGHPFLCATACAVIEAYKDENLIENSKVIGRILKLELENIKQRHPSVGDVRCMGLFACIELVKSRVTKEPLIPYNASGKQAALSKEITKRIMENGVYVPVRWMFLPISPPLSISEDELKNGLKVIDELLFFVDKLVAD